MRHRKTAVGSILVALSLSLTVPAIAGPFEDGSAAYKRHDYAQASALFRKSADQGEARGQYLLGYMYGHGQGGPTDYAKALLWNRKAADQGLVEAQLDMGYAYEKGRAVKQDYATAFSWYRKAADQGAAAGQYDVGHMYDSGMGVPQNYAMAVDWETKAANQGLVEAQINLGYAYAQGRGVNQDYATSLSWYRKAADRGAANGQYMVGKSYDQGRGAAQDYSMAAEWFRKAADQGNTDAQGYLAKYYALGTGVPKDTALALAYAKKAAAGGSQNWRNLPSLIKQMIAAEKQHPAAGDSQAQSGQSDSGVVQVAARGTVRPNHASALAQIRKSLTASGNVAISNLNYANGYSDGGAYVVEAQWTETVTRSTADARAAAVEKEKRILNDPNSSESQKEHAREMLDLASYGSMVGDVFGTDRKVGDRFDKTGVFRFRNTERGWLLAARVQ